MPKYKIKEGDKPWAFYKLTRIKDVRDFE